MSNKSEKSFFRHLILWPGLPYVLLAVVIFFAHFLFFNDFGVYEDDIAFIVNNYLKDFPLMGYIWWIIEIFFQGRPLGFIIPSVLVVLFGKMGTLSAIYIAGFLTIWINACLFYSLMFNITQLKKFAFLSAVLFSLFPADTTQLYLTHSLSLQYTLTFLLVALLFYRARHKGWAFVFAGLTLVTYETSYWIFLAAPLLLEPMPLDKTFFKKLIRHGLLMVVVFGAYLALRFSMGESRVFQLVSGSYFEITFTSIPFRVVFGFFLGPIVSLSIFMLGLANTLENLSIATLLGILFSFPFFFWIFRSMTADDALESKPAITELKGSFLKGMIRSGKSTFDVFRLFLISIVMYPLAYVFSFPFFPLGIYQGRMTSVHMSAAVPGAMLMGSVLFLAYQWFSKQKKTGLVLILLSLFLSLLVGYRIRIQTDFILGWKRMRRMTTQVLSQIQDVGPNTTVFIDTGDLQDTPYIEVYNNQFFMFALLNEIYYLPAGFSPDLMLLSTNFNRSGFYYEDGKYFYNYTLQPQTPIELKDGDVIYIQWDGNRFVRQTDAMEILGKTFNLKPPGRLTLTTFEKRSVFSWFYETRWLDVEGPIEEDRLWHLEAGD